MEASEHVFVGNSIQLTVAGGDRVPASGVALELKSGPLTYGTIVALGGDFYGTKDLSRISDSSQPVAAFNEAFSTLDTTDTNERGQIINVIDEEIAAVALAIKNQQPPSSAFDQLGDSLSGKWNAITYHGLVPIPDTYVGQMAAIVAGVYGRYMNLAAVNMDHFGDDAWKAYVAGHSAALECSKSLHGKPASSPDTAKGLRIAYAMNAFADHFLTDIFAGGHSRTPRRELYNLSQTTVSQTGMLARAMHNEDNLNGVLYVNRQNKADTWVAYGDGRVRNKENADNLNRAIAAVQRSADLIYGAYVDGYYDTTHAPMLELVPIAGGMDGPGTPTAGPLIRTAPLFCIDSYRKVYRRKQLSDTSDYEYWDSGDWSPAKMYLEVVGRDYLGLGPKAIPAPV